MLIKEGKRLWMGLGLASQIVYHLYLLHAELLISFKDSVSHLFLSHTFYSVSIVFVHHYDYQLFNSYYHS